MAAPTEQALAKNPVAREFRRSLKRPIHIKALESVRFVIGDPSNAAGIGAH